MGALRVGADEPDLGLLADVRERGEDVGFEHFPAKGAVAASDVAVPVGLLESHAMPITPRGQRPGEELGPVVAPQGPGGDGDRRGLVEDGEDPQPRERRPHLDGEVLPIAPSSSTFTVGKRRPSESMACMKASAQVRFGRAARPSGAAREPLRPRSMRRHRSSPLCACVVNSLLPKDS